MQNKLIWLIWSNRLKKGVDIDIDKRLVLLLKGIHSCEFYFSHKDWLQLHSWKITIFYNIKVFPNLGITWSKPFQFVHNSTKQPWFDLFYIINCRHLISFGSFLTGVTFMCGMHTLSRTCHLTPCDTYHHTWHIPCDTFSLSYCTCLACTPHGMCHTYLSHVSRTCNMGHPMTPRVTPTCAHDIHCTHDT